MVKRTYFISYNNIDDSVRAFTKKQALVIFFIKHFGHKTPKAKKIIYKSLKKDAKVGF